MESTKKRQNSNVITKKEKKRNVVKEKKYFSKEDDVIKETRVKIESVKDEKKKNNKLVYTVLALIIIVFLIIYFATKDNYGNNNIGATVDSEDALSIGEKKYMEFIWLVDGAFNDSRYNSHIKVNDKQIDEKSLKFSCKYDEKKEWCKGENFEDAFSNVFSSNISYKDVYGDGLAYNWYEKREDGYYFKNSTGCDVARMSNNQTLELVKEEPNKLTFKVKYVDNLKSGIYEGEHKIVREFSLVREGNKWKVSSAHYHDLCFQDYYIPRQY